LDGGLSRSLNDDPSEIINLFGQFRVRVTGGISRLVGVKRGQNISLSGHVFRRSKRMKRNTRRVLALSASIGLPALGAFGSAAWAQTNGVWDPTGFTGANGSGTYSTTTNWVGGIVADGTGATADFSQLNITANTTVTVDAAHNLGTLLFADTTPSNSWILTNSSSAGITLATSTGTPTISVVGLGVGNSNGAFLTLPLTGTQGFTKTGNGDLVIGGGTANAITGQILVSAGYLGTTHGADFKNITGTINVSSGAVFDANQSFDANNFTNSFIISGSGNSNLTPPSGVSGGYSGGTGAYGALNVRGNATVSGAISLAGSTTISHDYNYGTVSNTISGAYPLTFKTLVSTQADLLITGAIQTGSNPVIITGASSALNLQGVELSGNNTYTGNTIVASGVLRVFNPNNLGGYGAGTSNPVQLSGGTLDLVNSTSTNFIHPVILTASSTIAPDRSALGSSTVNQSLGVLTTQGGTLTATPGQYFNGGSGNLTFASTTVGGGVSSIIALNGTNTGTPSTTLNLGVVSRSAGGGTLDFPSTSTGTVLVGNAATPLLGGYATYGGGTYFAKVVTGGQIAAASETYQDDPSQWITGQDVSENAGFNSNTVAPASIDSLRFNSSTTNTVNIGSTLSITTGGILVPPSAGAKTIAGGTLEGSAGGDLIILQNSASPMTISSVIADNSSPTALTKSGTGTLILTSPETYTGGTSIQAGSLQITSSLITGNVIDNGTLTFAQTTNGSFAGNISGTGTVVKTNAGTAGNTGVLLLTGNNSYSGGTTVSEGTIQFGSATALGTGLVTVSGQSSNTSYLDLNGFSPSNNFSISGDDYLWNSNASTSVLSGGVVANSFARFGNSGDTAGTDNITINGPVSGYGVNKYGTGLIVFNNTSTYTNYTVVYGGVLRANEGVGLPSSVPLTLSGGVIEMSTNFVRSLGTTGGTVSLSGASGFSAYGGPITVSIGGLSTPTALVWGSTANFNPTTLTLNANTANSTLTFQNPLDFNGANQTISVGAATAIAGGVLSNATGTGGLIKTGAGTLVLTAANTYNGTTTISAGTLQMGNGGTTGVIPGNVVDNAALSFNRSDAALTFNNNISGTGTLTQSGANVLLLSGSNSYTGQTNVTAGELQLGSANAIGTQTAAVVVSNGGTLDQNGFPQGLKPISIIGTGYNGSGALINSSATSSAEVGTVTLTGNATIGVESSAYNGHLDIGGGTTAINGSTYTLTKAGPGNLRVNGGTVTLGALNISAGTLSVLSNNNLLYAGLPVGVSAGATLFLYNSSDAANTTFATGATLENNTGTNSLSGTTTLTGAGKANFNFDNKLTLNVSGPITGTGGISMNAGNGGDFLSTSTSNNYSGGTLINSGIFTAGAAGTLSPNSAFQIYGGTLDASAYNNSIASLVVNTGGTLNLGFGNVLTDLGTATFAGTLNISAGTVGTLPETLMTYTSYTGAFNTSINVPTGDSLAYTSHALEIISGSGGPATLTWNNSGGGDGKTWNTTQLNFVNGTTAAAYSDTSNGITGDNVSFTDANNGNYSVSIPATVHPTSVLVNASGNYTFNGSAGIAGTTSLVKLGTGMLTLSTSNTFTGGTNIGGGTLVLENANAFPISTPLTIANGATVDVGKYTMAISNSSAGTVYQEVAAAFNGGRWTGTNGSIGVITSSAAASDTTHLTAVGVATGLTSFEGTAVPAGDVLVKYTYYGDANLSGAVDGSDYSLVDNGFLQHLTGWQNGDFNYDGVVNGSDYTLMDNAFNSQGAAIAAEVATPTAEIATAGGSSSVPEPASLGLLGIGAVGLLGRRGGSRSRRCR
jgi:fibronectin-binding autotransporter adhesin